jgi:hypothetical protein
MWFATFLLVAFQSYVVYATTFSSSGRPLKYRRNWADPKFNFSTHSTGLNIYYGADAETIKITHPKARHPAVEYFPLAQHIEIPPHKKLASIPLSIVQFTDPDKSNMTRIYIVLYTSEGALPHFALRIGESEVQVQVDSFRVRPDDKRVYNAATVILSRPLDKIKEDLHRSRHKVPTESRTSPDIDTDDERTPLLTPSNDRPPFLTNVDPMARRYTYRWKYTACKVGMSNEQLIDLVLRRAKKYLNFHFHITYHNCHDFAHNLIKDLCGRKVTYRFFIIQKLIWIFKMSALRPIGFLGRSLRVLLDKLTGGREMPEGTSGEEGHTPIS